MAYQVLARKWRPRRFQQVVGQGPIVQSLLNAIKKDAVAHAYLFTGTRGVGKTSVARLLAKALCCQRPAEDGNPCLECESCLNIDQGSSLDVAEIDGASYNGVENVRQIVENAQFLPTVGEKKVYIIDEVHMLSTSAFNALLKTLEEPPAHVVFILATTEPGKLLDTVVSRCQRFDFLPLSPAALKEHLEQILQAESIAVEDVKREFLVEAIVEQADGSVRDGLSLLDQVLTYCGGGDGAEGPQLTEEIVVRALGVARPSSVRELLGAILKGEQEPLQQQYYNLLRENVGASQIGHALLKELYRSVTSVRSDTSDTEEGPAPFPVPELIWVYETLAKDLTWIADSLDPRRILEVALIKLAKRREFFTPPSPSGEEEKQHAPSPSSESALSSAQASSSPVGPGPARETPAGLGRETETGPKPGPNPELTSEPGPAPGPELSPGPAPKARARTWEDFLQFLRQHKPVLGANLEQGNILELEKGKELTEARQVQVGFKRSGKIFADYLNDSQVRNRLQALARDFFENAEILFTFDVVEGEKQREFKTQVDKEMESQEQKNDQREQALKADPLVQSASRLFESQVDKVILNDQV